MPELRVTRGRWPSAVASTAGLRACGIAAQSPTPAPTVAPTPADACLGHALAVAASRITRRGRPPHRPTPGADPQPTHRRAGHLRQLAPLHRHRRGDRRLPDARPVHRRDRHRTSTYIEAIADNAEFFGQIQPDLAAGHSTGYDVIAPSDWMIERMIRLGYLQPLDKSLLPNWQANAQDVLRDPWYDPGNVLLRILWQAGIVGIGYNPKLTGRAITTFDDLLDPAFAGRVGLFSEMSDTMSLTLLSMGVQPEDATDRRRPGGAGQAARVRPRPASSATSTATTTTTRSRPATWPSPWPGQVTSARCSCTTTPTSKFVVPRDGRHAVRRQHGHPQRRRSTRPTRSCFMDYWYTLEAADR